MPAGLLAVDGLSVEFDTDNGAVQVVDDVSLTIGAGDTLGLVGESGCGKSMTALSVMRLIRAPGRITAGSMHFEGRDLRDLAEADMRRIRGKEISMIFQEPMSSLNPVFRIGDQIAESARLHLGMSRTAAWSHAVDMLDRVRIPAPGQRARDYPHVLSGGMRQRVMIAMALVGNPKLLIADELSTALDVTVQAQVLELLRDLQAEFGMSLLLITHDLGVIAEMCDQVAVMYAGKVVEQGSWGELFRSPQHPYTEGLLKSIPEVAGKPGSKLGMIRGQVPSPLEWGDGCRFASRCDYRFDRCDQTPPLFQIGARRSACWLCEDGARTPRQDGFRVDDTASPPAPRPELPAVLLRVEGLETHLPVRGGVLRRATGVIRAVDCVDLDVHEGETLGLVGESGCGKTTLGRSILRLVKPTAGRVTFDGAELGALSSREMRKVRSQMQMIFQDPASSLNPRLSVKTIIGEGLTVHGVRDRGRREELVVETLTKVGMRPDDMSKYPHQFSGGQRQRIGIARALILSPRLVIADEPVSALDVSIQSQVLNLMVDLREEFGLTYIFIAHNLAAVSHISDRVAVMYLGKVVELAAAGELYATPMHPYTRALLSAIPHPDPHRRAERIELTGDVPSPLAPPSGCPFRTRCALAREKGTEDGICAEVAPALAEVRPGHWASCHFADEQPC